MIQAMENHQASRVARLVTQEVAADPGTVAAMCFDSSGKLLAQAGDPWPKPSLVAHYFPQLFTGKIPANGLAGHWSAGEYELFISANPVLDQSGGRLGSTKVAFAGPLPQTGPTTTFVMKTYPLPEFVELSRL